jgi:hypothetical protein
LVSQAEFDLNTEGNRYIYIYIFTCLCLSFSFCLEMCVLCI